MSIRCLELNIPAIIGIGEKFNELLSKNYVEIDCNQKRLIIEYEEHSNYTKGKF